MENHPVARFRDSTGTSSIRRHLYDLHLSEWISICDQYNIPITGKTARDRVNDYRLAQRTQASVDQGAFSPLDSERREFSKEVFVEALVEWIVADDQVRFSILITSLILMLPRFRLCVSSKAKSLERYFSCCGRSSVTQIYPLVQQSNVV